MSKTNEASASIENFKLLKRKVVSASGPYTNLACGIFFISIWK